MSRLANFLLCSCLALAQAPDPDTLWRDYIDWIKSQSSATDIRPANYRANLLKAGMAAAEADERAALVARLLPERRYDLIALALNRLYADPGQDRFTTEPNAFLVSSIQGLPPGEALDVAMGQGRNAIHLARQGWNVTGFDVAEEGLRIANENAAKAGVALNAVRAPFETFDYGKERWDLVCFLYTDAPVIDPAYVARIRDSLKPGGLVLIERPYRAIADPDPEMGPLREHDKPNALLNAWAPDFQIVNYQDMPGVSDWQQTSVKRTERRVRIVRLLARKL